MEPRREHQSIHGLLLEQQVSRCTTILVSFLYIVSLAFCGFPLDLTLELSPETA